METSFRDFLTDTILSSDPETMRNRALNLMVDDAFERGRQMGVIASKLLPPVPFDTYDMRHVDGVPHTRLIFDLAFLALRGNKVGAIKALRCLYGGMGIRDAKNMIEALYGTSYPSDLLTELGFPPAPLPKPTAIEDQEGRFEREG